LEEISGIQVRTTSAVHAQCRASGEAAFNGSLLHGVVFGMATTKITITLEDQ
jgi:hypothetical protein